MGRREGRARSRAAPLLRCTGRREAQSGSRAGLLSRRLGRREGRSAAGDRCGSAGFVRRKDDNEDVVRARLKAYHAQTEPLIDYYRRQGKVSTVDGMADISAVAKEIDQALTGQGAKGVKNRAKTPG